MTETKKQIQMPIEETVAEEPKKYDDEKRIVLWKNEDATDDNNQPSIRGQVTINGIKWYISLWNYKDKNGKVYCQGRVRKSDEMINQTKDSLL